MGSLVKHGGYVVTTPSGNYVSTRDVGQQTLQTIADLLGIERADREKLAAESIRTVFIYTPDKRGEEDTGKGNE
jgi:hypothetical protein